MEIEGTGVGRRFFRGLTGDERVEDIKKYGEQGGSLRLIFDGRAKARGPNPVLTTRNRQYVA